MRINENVGATDRVLRFFVGLGVLGLGLFGPATGAAGVVAALTGVVLLLTSAAGYCPLYRLAGIRTAGRSEHHPVGRS